MQSQQYELDQMVNYKITLLEDENGLSGRLQILSHVLQDAQLESLSSLDHLTLIRFHQCGVLRWMVEQGHCNLSKDVSKYSNLLMRFAGKLHFTNCTESMTLGDCLCFAMIEFDGLVSLQWLCEIHGCPHETFGGFNLLYLGAYLGRTEMVPWLITTTSWDNLVGEVCQHKACPGVLAVLHVAASRGHIIIADLLLNFDSN